MSIYSTDTECKVNKITLRIDGQTIQAEEGITVLEAAKHAGIYIPALCYYPGLDPLSELKPDRACRLCVIEVEGATEPQLSCITPAVEGMTVQTNTPMLQKMKRNSLQLILARHPNSCLDCHRRERCSPFDICLRHVAVTERCVFCPKNGTCELQRAVDHSYIISAPNLGWEGDIAAGRWTYNVDTKALEPSDSSGAALQNLLSGSI